MTNTQFIKKTGPNTQEHTQRLPAGPALKRIAPSVAVQLAISNPHISRPETFLQLQRMAGNGAIQGLLQRKLVVGAANDPYEQEADRVASQVMTMPSAQGEAVRRAPEEDELQAKPLAGNITPLAQRASDEEEEIRTSRQDPREGFEAGNDVEDRLQAQKGGGSPLPDEVRGFMEPCFGTDFSGVRVHTGSEAAQLNRQLSAQAFTQGQDIYMGEGKYEPGSADGQKLLAHELTHVVQQTGKAGVQRKDTDAASIQRYTMASMSQPGPINWLAETTSVTRPDEGLSGGIFFFHSDEEVVVKPEQDALPAAVHAMEQTLHTADVPVAASMRIVEKGSTEAAAIKKTLQDKPGIQAGKKPDLINYLDGAASLLVLPKVGGKSLSSMLKTAEIQEYVASLVRILNQPKLLNQIGRMSIIDAFMGNEDRLNAFYINQGVKGKSNLGNIMISAEQNSNATAIDNAAFRWNAPPDQGATPMNSDYSIEMIQKLLQNPGAQADFFFREMLSYLPPATSDFDPKGYFQAQYDQNAARANMAQGMHEAAERLIHAMADKGSRSTIKAAMPDQKRQWGAMRGRAEWLAAVEGGANQLDAMSTANTSMLMRRGSKAFRPQVEAVLQVDPDLSHIPDKPAKSGILNRNSAENKAFQLAKDQFIEALENKAGEMHTLAAEIDAVIAQARGADVNAKEAQGKLEYVVKKLGSDYGATLARMTGQFKTNWLTWMGKLDTKKDAKEKARLTKTFDLLRQGQTALTEAVGRAKAVDTQHRLGVQRKAVDGAQANPPGDKK